MNEKNIVEWRGTVRVLRAETWLTVYRTISIAKRARVEPRTQMHVTVKMLIWVVITNEKVFGNFGICFRSCIKDLDGANKREKL